MRGAGLSIFLPMSAVSLTTQPPPIKQEGHVSAPCTVISNTGLNSSAFSQISFRLETLSPNGQSTPPLLSMQLLLGKHAAARMVVETKTQRRLVSLLEVLEDYPVSPEGEAFHHRHCSRCLSSFFTAEVGGEVATQEGG